MIPGASSTEMTHAYPKLRQCVVSCTPGNVVILQKQNRIYAGNDIM